MPTRHLFRSLLMVLCAALLLPLIYPQVSAQDPDPPAQPDKRVIYVPYKDLQQALDKPDGVFLPYAEFEALWKKATATAPDRRPDTAALIHSVEYDGQVTG
ncbi:MAG: hypothetical protein AB7S36_09090, partial [Planctomycetota bacterium]